MYNEFIGQLKKYLDLGEELAVAQVISRQTPSSGKPGDKAIILKDGTLIGWIGGGCVKGIAIKEGIEAIKDKKSRLVKISPESGDSQDEEHKTYQMTCHSGGSMELFIEPVIPNPHIVIVGKSNIARALAKIANAANQRVTVLAKAADKAMFPDVKLVDSNSDFSNVL
ncbi:MAG: XshC-Cox1-family protein, partial [Bacteroidetes bacterium]|nr:XshC-Cox1-family protein [Bacteroidota bacterium]